MGENKKKLLKSATTAEWWIVVLLFAFPFLGYLPHPTLLLCGMVGAIHGLWLCRLRKGKRCFDFSIVDIFVILLAVLFLLSGVFSLRLDAFWEGLARVFLMMLYLPLVDFWGQKEWRERGAFVLQISGGVAAFLGTFQYILGEAELKWVDIERFSNIGGRVTGGFGNPNVFSVYLLLVIPIPLVVLFRESDSVLSRFLALISLFAEMICLILTWSRGAWLGVMLEVLLFFLLFSRRTRKALPVGIVPTVVASFFLPQSIVDRFQSIGDLSESSIRYRLFVWKGTWRMLCDHPFGIGLGDERFKSYYLSYAVKGTETVIHTHQLFLQIFCELGVFGLILFLIFLCFFFFECIRQNRVEESGRRLQILGGGLAIVGALTAGMFDHVWYHHGVFCLFWIMAAMTASAFERGKSKKAP